MDTESFQKILGDCKDYVPLGHNLWQQKFIFGESVMEAILDLNFECTKCGICCKDVTNKPCPLQDTNNGNICKVYHNDTYPLTCATYPFIIDETASEGYGFRCNLPCNPFTRESKPYSYWEFGVADEMLTLIVKPEEPCWSSGKNNLREYYMKVLTELLTLKDDRKINPPHETLIGFLNPETGNRLSRADEEIKTFLKTTKYEDILANLSQRLIENWNYIDAKLFKIRHKDYSLGI